MTLNNGKHNIEEINGILCTLVEGSVNEDRLKFLSNLLIFNGYTVQTLQNEDGSYNLGVTDLIFNPIIDVYKRRLKTPTGHKVTPAYWLQQSMDETEAEMNYWTFKP
jgi:hypothetical protein